MRPPALLTPALLTLVRRAPWRRFCVALALVAIALQQLAVAAATRMDPLATGPAWPEAAAVCHADGGVTGDAPSTDESPARCAASCPLCLTVQQLGRMVVPGAVVLPAPHPQSGSVMRTGATAAVVATLHRAWRARGPPIAG